MRKQSVPGPPSSWEGPGDKATEAAANHILQKSHSYPSWEMITGLLKTADIDPYNQEMAPGKI